MWKCANCGEEENEESFRYCFSCGAGLPDAASEEVVIPAVEEDVPPSAVEEEGDGLPPEPVAPPHVPATREQAGPHAAEHERGGWLPRGLGGIGQRIRQAVPWGDDHAVSVRVSQEAREAIDLLVQAERFETPEDAAGFLIDKGVEAQSEFLYLLWQKLKEIERLREELRNLGGPAR